MNREMFVKVATAVLRRMRDPEADAKAEAIAQQMDLLADVLGEAPIPSAPPAAAPPSPPAAFPFVNPLAAEPIPEPEPEPESAPAFEGPPLIIPATTIPDRVERANQPAAPVRSLRERQPRPGRLKVEDLNLMIQERTPKRLTIEVPGEDGAPSRRVVYEQNVLSLSQANAVKLIYGPSNQTNATYEIMSAEEVMNVDDSPFDLTAIMARIKSKALAALMRPDQIVSRPPRRPQGPVQLAGQYYDGATTAPEMPTTSMEGTFGASAQVFVQPAPRDVESSFHPTVVPALQP